MGFHERTEEILAFADHYGVALTWDADRSHTRVCSRAVHLHVVLGQIETMFIRVYN